MRFLMRAKAFVMACTILIESAAFGAEPMTPSDIQKTFFNGQPFTASTPGGTKFKMTYTPDGRMTREPLAQTGDKVEGSWKLSAKGFCTTWQHAKSNCFTVVPSGEKRWSVLKAGTTIATTIAVWSK
jgi:YD repeat-containing protein